MTSISSQAASYNNFDFSMTTSSGDKISLNLYDNKSTSSSISQDENSKTMQMSLRHEQGYSFSYEGNGIDANDQKEIDAAMKEIKPMLNKYLSNVESSKKLFGGQSLREIASDIGIHLPSPKNENTANYTKDKLLDTVDDSLKNTPPSKLALDSMKALFDRLLKGLEENSLYV